MNRAITILAILLCAQIGALAFRSYTSDEQASSIVRPGKLLEGISPDQVGTVIITDDKGEQIALTREGGGWVVRSAGGFPCGEKAGDLVAKLVGLESEEVAGREASSHGRFEVTEGDAARKVRLEDGSGKELATLLLGRYVSGGQYVRLEGSDEVHRVGESLTWQCSTQPSNYVDTQLIDFDATKAKAIAWRDAEGVVTLAFERTVPDGATQPVWRATAPEPFPSGSDKVKSVVDRLAKLRFAEPVSGEAAPEHGLAKPEATIVVTLETGEEVVLEIGADVDKEGEVAAAAAGKSRYARLKGKPFVVELASYTVEPLLKDAAHFRAKEEPAAPAEDAPAPAGDGGAPAGGAAPAPGASGASPAPAPGADGDAAPAPGEGDEAAPEPGAGGDAPAGGAAEPEDAPPLSPPAPAVEPPPAADESAPAPPGGD